MRQFYLILAKKATASALIGLFLSLPLTALAKIPNDLRYSDQQLMWEQIKAPAAWDNATGSAQVTVAVIDTGIDVWNDDLRANIWHNLKEIPDNQLDDDNNGFIDDTTGWNFVDQNNDARPSVFDNKDDAEAVKHGTLVAGLIGAVGDNGLAGTGLNWQVKIMPLRAIANSGNGIVLNVVQAVDYAIQQKADVISMSFVGDYQDPELKAAFRRAYDLGIVVVAASGNNRANQQGDLDQFPQFPVCFDRGDDVNWILGVTSLNVRGGLSRFADYGSCVDISAPGENIYSTDRYAPQYGYPNNFSGPYQGTSFAAPLVAGAAALIKSIRPDWSARDIIDNLLQTADPVDALSPSFVGKIGRGRLNLDQAITRAKLGAPPVVIAAQKTLSSTVLFYLAGPELRRFDLLTSATQAVANSSDGVIKDFSALDLNSDGERQLMLLIKKAGYYYVSLLKEDGTLLEELPVLKNAIDNRTIVTINRLRFIRLGPTEVKWVVEVTKPGKKPTTSIMVLDAQAAKIERELKFPNGLAGWDVALHNQSIVTAELKKTSLNLTETPLLTTGKKQTWTLRNVTAFQDLRVGNTLGVSRDEASIIIKRANQIQWFTVDIGSNSWQNGSLLGQKTKPWKMLLTDVNQDQIQELFPIQLIGGNFSIFTPREKVIKTITLPVIKGGVF